MLNLLSGERILLCMTNAILREAVILAAVALWAHQSEAALSQEPLKIDDQGTERVYATLKDVKWLGRTPTRASRQIAKSPLGIGYETLDRTTFDPKWTFRPIGEAGVKWARCQTGWMRCEKEKGRYDFGWLDEVVDGLAAEGVETWLSVSFGNPLYTPCKKFEEAWAKAKQEGTVVPGRARGYVGETAYYNGEAAMTAWKAYVRALARHFNGRVHVFEIWNEPEWFWYKETVSPLVTKPLREVARDFADFVKITGDVIREEVPDAKISFNLAKPSSGWMPALAEAGIGSSIDIYNYHGYEPYPESALDKIFDQARALFRCRNGLPPEIWQGESGRATGRSQNGLCLPTQYSQARFIARRVTADVAQGAAVSSIFTVTDFISYYADGRDQYYGVLDGKTHEPKHGWHTLQCMGWLLDGLVRAPENFVMFKTYRDREFCDHLPFAAVKTASFKRGGVPVFAFWQPQHVELNAAPLRGRLTFVGGSQMGALRRPVLIDPVRCEVWDVSAYVRPPQGSKAWHAHGIESFVPCYALDYPLFLTDASVLEQ